MTKRKLEIQPVTSHSLKRTSSNIVTRKLHARCRRRCQSATVQNASQGINTIANWGLNVETASKPPARIRRSVDSRNSAIAMNAAARRLGFCSLIACSDGKLPKVKTAMVSQVNKDHRNRSRRNQSTKLTRAARVETHKNTFCAAGNDR